MWKSSQSLQSVMPWPLAGRRRHFRQWWTLSMGWVDPWFGLAWVGLGQDFSVFGGFGPATEPVQWGLRASLLSCC